MIWIKRFLFFVIASAIFGAIVLAFLPEAIQVDIETVAAKHMEVTVRDDGRTRIRERYSVSTPIAGRLRRIDFDVGDEVIAGKTIVARMEPTAPTLLDPRALAQARARVKSAQGRLKKAEVELERAQAELEQARVEDARQQELAERGATPAAEVDAARLEVRTKLEDVKAAEFSTEIARYELELEQAGLLHVAREQGENDPESEQSNPEFEIRSPITGRVLRVVQESSAVLSPGTPLLEIGDPEDLEVVVDVLSSDATRVQAGQIARFEQWGGPMPLDGVVRLVEPSGFTKISALGVEEQRVNVILDFIGSSSERGLLGDGYRVEANIVVWEAEDVLTVPTGALFRDQEEWAVFVVEDQVAHRRHVEIGENNGLVAQILSGIKAGDQVILHPGDQLSDGAAVEVRQSEK